MAGADGDPPALGPKAGCGAPDAAKPATDAVAAAPVLPEAPEAPAEPAEEVIVGSTASEERTDTTGGGDDRTTEAGFESSADITGLEDEDDGDSDLASVSSKNVFGELQFGRLAGRVGLENLGNSCFMNAGLQCLSHIEPFAAFFLSGKYKDEVNRSSASGCKGELADAFAELQGVLWRSEQPQHRPTSFREQLQRVRPDLFQGHEQQDVQEFLAFCLDGLHEDLNRVPERPEPLTLEEEREDERVGEPRGEEFVAALSWMRYLEHGRSFIVDLMQGQLRSTLSCVECGHRSRRFEAFLYLSLPVSWDMCNVSDALAAYLAEETLTGDEQWFCEKCQKKVDARKKIDIWKLPPVLVIHLKRFEHDSATGRFRKIGRHLAMPHGVDLSEFCSSTQAHGANYDVTCVANHRGRFDSGHYTATCYMGSRFFEFDDTEVRRLSKHADIVGAHAYVLFLVRRSPTEGYFVEGHRAPLLRRQATHLPELWPQRHSAAVDVEVLSSLMRPSASMELGGPTTEAEAHYLMRLPNFARTQSLSEHSFRGDGSTRNSLVHQPPRRAPCCSDALSGLFRLRRPTPHEP